MLHYSQRIPQKPGILLIGSPTYFPNMKMPKLLDEMGIDLIGTDFEMNSRLNIRPKSKLGFKRLLKHIIRINYYNDISTSFIFNANRINYIKSMVKNNHINGVIYHVLKGHVCYDFELDFIEDIFNKLNIPVFRLETDYNEQDVEQLRIRTEAFFEMLSINTSKAM